jgi:cytochrome P450
MPSSLMFTPRDEHAFLRRQLSPSFSERSMRAQEPIIGAYIDLLIQRLRDNGDEGSKALNMCDWIAYTTFDMIGDLALGSSLGCLDSSDYHPWVRLITSNSITTTVVGVINNLGGQPLVHWASELGLMQGRDQHLSMMRSKIQQRIDLGVERLDLIEGLLRKHDEGVSGRRACIEKPSYKYLTTTDHDDDGKGAIIQRARN